MADWLIYPDARQAAMNGTQRKYAGTLKAAAGAALHSFKGQSPHIVRADASGIYPAAYAPLWRVLPDGSTVRAGKA